MRFCPEEFARSVKNMQSHGAMFPEDVFIQGLVRMERDGVKKTNLSRTRAAALAWFDGQPNRSALGALPCGQLLRVWRQIAPAFGFMGITETDASSMLIGCVSMHLKHFNLALQLYTDANAVLAARVYMDKQL